ncbi:GcrA family cell cycle regulator [Rhizobiaceae bacterium n13]|uniref:GcrA family cell cycle regulator n=1 Tax=Ferirhizobium litorale TaxID=2927786 RepID=UPI0024B2D610|nr:GcrA family cell cycle regulator [Fererhizobium litorale]MDI7862558.1 GcrA family cell cycle regulator [Fererhizobium litorale]
MSDVLNWPDLTSAEKCAEICTVYSNKANTASRLAIALSVKFGRNITRNAIMGYYHRFPDLLASAPLSGASPTQKGVRAKPKSLKRVAPPRQTKPAPQPKFTAQPCAPPPPPVHVPKPDPLMASCVEVTGCRYPVDGEREHTKFCDHRQADGSSYCEYHRLACINPRAGREAARELNRRAA